MTETTDLIGRVTRCDTRGFVGAIRLPEPDLPTFGTFCRVEAQQGQSQVVGLIYDIRIEDDEFTRRLAIAEGLTEEQLADNRANRLVPVELSVLSVGYRRNGRFHQTLPPQPPVTLAEIHVLPADEILAFTENLDFLALLAAAQDAPTEELLGAALRLAAAARPEGQRESFLVEAGRACARLLANDLPRLELVLRGLNPERAAG